MRYVITGGCGFIGSHLAEYLLNKYIIKTNIEIVIIENFYSGILENLSASVREQVHIINLDIRHPDIEKYIQENDIIIHLAAISSLPECQSNPVEAFDINLNGTINILEIARKKNAKRVIFASTSAVYEKNTNFPCRETDSIKPTLIYSLTKSAAEEVCLSYIKNYDLDVRVIRFFNIYGGNQDFRRTSPPLTIYIINELINDRPPILHSDGTQKRDYLYISDLLELVDKVIHKDILTDRIYNACSGMVYSVAEIYEIISKKLKESNYGVGIEPIYNDPTLFWQRYNNLMNGNNPINKDVIVEEVSKYTLGSNASAAREFDWYSKINMKAGLEEIINLKLDSLEIPKS
jgi:UDP-glucose 4-epimerase